MKQGFRVAIPGKDAQTASPKEVITDTSLISLPIHWEGAWSATSPGGSGFGDLNATAVIPHDLGYAPIHWGWASGIQYDGTNYLENPLRKLTMPVYQQPFLYRVKGFEDRVEVHIRYAGFAGSSASFTINGYLYIFEFKPEGLSV